MTLGVLAGMAVVAIWSSAAVLARSHLRDVEIGTIEIAGVRHATAALVLLPALLFRTSKASIASAANLVFVLQGAPIVLATMVAIQAIGANASFIAPALVPAISIMLAHDFAPTRLLGAALIAAGSAIYMYAMIDFQEPAEQAAAGCLVLAALCGSIHLRAAAVSTLTTLEIAAIVNVLSLPLVGTAAVVFGACFTCLKGDVLLAEVMLQGLLMGAASVLLLTFSARALGAVGAALIFVLFPPTLLVLSALVLSEEASLLQLAATAVVCVGSLFATLMRAPALESQAGGPASLGNLRL